LIRPPRYVELEGQFKVTEPGPLDAPGPRIVYVNEGFTE
jgi:hypothetical protein